MNGLISESARFSIKEATERGYLNMTAEAIIRDIGFGERIAPENRGYEKTIIFIIDGQATDCVHCGAGEMLPEWNTCPHCGTDRETVDEEYTDGQKAADSPFAKKYGIVEMLRVTVYDKTKRAPQAFPDVPELLGLY